MKHGRRLTGQEKILLKQEGFDAKYFLTIAKAAQNYEFVEVQTGKVLTVRR